MTDVRTELRRASRSFEVPDATFERLLERKGRVRRRQHVASLAVAVVVATGSVGAVGALLSMDGGDPEAPVGIPGATGRPIPALWPEHDAEQLRAAQEAVDAGDASLAWRLDPEETAVRFVRSVLGWTDPDERLHHTAVEAPSGLATVDVFTTPASCQEESCDTVRDVIVQLLRLGDDDGVWSVVSAESPSFNMQFRIGHVVRAGDVLDVISGHETGTEIAVGVEVFEPCSGSHEEIAYVRDHRVGVPLKGVAEGCPGYVYILTPAATGPNEPGRTLLEGRPDSGRPIDDIAVAPVFIVTSEGSPSVSDIPQPEEA
jgi:hypothetical protein